MNFVLLCCKSSCISTLNSLHYSFFNHDVSPASNNNGTTINLALFVLITSLLTLTPVLGDAFGDLWSKYCVQQQQQQAASQSYESTMSRRERNLDHWVVPTAAACLGLHPETLKPLPRHVSESSSSSASAAAGSTVSPATSAPPDRPRRVNPLLPNGVETATPSRHRTMATHLNAYSTAGQLKINKDIQLGKSNLDAYAILYDENENVLNSSPTIDADMNRFVLRSRVFSQCRHALPLHRGKGLVSP